MENGSARLADATSAQPVLAPAACARCGTQLAPSLLACPSCSTLVHGDELTRLAATARAAEEANDVPGALEHWRRALDLLPSSSKQYGAIVERVGTLTNQASTAARDAEAEPVRSRFGKYGAVVSGAVLVLLKFKFAIVFLLTKGKLLLFGLTKLSTLSSMALFLGFDAALLGWQLALGIVLSIYVHEMGHVAALHRHGIKASSPMFLPGIGAFIRAQQRIHGEWAEADVGLAGPLWGLGAAVVAWGVYHYTGTRYWATIAHWGALINLFNLLPVWQLDGAHAFQAMSRPHRLAAVVAIAAALALTGERLLWLPLLGAAWAVFRKPADRADVRALGYYVILVGALSLVAVLSRGVN
jgi:Zn-dependent protease